MSGDRATETTPEIAEVILALADDEHLMGQQHTEWIGVAPFLEEDLAFSSIGQDELGHAALLYAILAGDDDRAIDRLAFERGADEYRSCWLVERPSMDWSDALIRHWLYDQAELLRWDALTDSSVPALAAVAARALREEAFHRRHADGLLDVLLDDEESRTLLQRALTELAPIAIGLFDPVAGEVAALAEGVISSGADEQRVRWQALTEQRFGPVVWGQGPAQHGRTTRSDSFAPLMSRMREVLDLDATAVW